MAEIDVKVPVGRGRAQSNRIAVQGATEPNRVAMKTDLAFVLDFAHVIVGTVFEGREHRGEGARAGPIAGQGHLQR